MRVGTDAIIIHEEPSNEPDTGRQTSRREEIPREETLLCFT